ncbi:hypothetical protein [Parvibaculum sp.]|uniref:hypothetical protein n=1 Tax=Parvibaculum sp. TaxID=2024848 RepID=UPI002BA59D53|nr:hypothetical protein [Parvibaculum sp.]HUD52245.1 hypothetical protein [Parvibaculum sp.]
MCDRAPPGTVLPVPAPVGHWAVIVCAASGQALVPVEGTVWLAHGTREPVSILALPPAVAPLPKTPDYDPRYSVRFKALYAAEATGEKRKRAYAYLKAALRGDSSPIVDRVVQLDAVSIIYDLRYNIYFFLQGRRPHAALACLDQCRQALVIDILTADEANARMARLR